MTWMRPTAVSTVLFPLVLAAAIAPVRAGAEVTLVDAVKRGDQSAIRTLLSQDLVDANDAEPDGTTALHWASHRGDIDTVRRLIEAGADIAVTNRYGISALWLAAAEGHGVVVEALLGAGADPNTSRGNNGESVLMIAARGGRLDVLERLVGHDADVNVQDRIREQSAVMWAAAEGHAEAVRLLARTGADLGARSRIEMTPLMFAIRGGNSPTVGVLLDEGADLAATGPDGTTMLGLAIINAHYELGSYLVRRRADPNGNDSVHGRPLQALAFVRRAINRGLAPILPRQDSESVSALALAEELIAYGAVVNDPIDWDSVTHQPPHMSLPFFRTMSYVGATPLLIASKNCDLALMQFLVVNGADFTRATAQGVTPILAAAGVGHSSGESPETAEEALAAVQFLYDLGGDLRRVTPSAEGGGSMRRGGSGLGGSSALHGAVTREAADLIRWLIAHDAPLEHKNDAGKTALEWVYEASPLTATKLVRRELGDMLRQAMVAKGIPIPDGPLEFRTDY